MKRNNILLGLIVILAFFLRFFHLGEIPKGFSSDEAAYGYNAYSILKTGKDEYGIVLPQSLKSFGEYKAPFYVYVTVPSIMVFGLSEFSTRFPAAIFGVLTVIVSYYLAKEIFKGKKSIGLTAAIIVALIPWHLQFTKIAYEGSAALLLLSLGIVFFLKALKRSFFLYLSAIFFALTFYCHYVIRVFVPIYVLVLVLVYRDMIIRKKKELIISIIIAFMTLIPIFPNLFSAAGITRASYISLFTDKGPEYAIEQKRQEHLWDDQKQSFFPVLLHNKLTEFSMRFFNNYLSHFDFTFLFMKGDASPFFRTPDFGLILVSFLPFFFLGFFKLLQARSIAKNIVLSWLLLSPVASSLTRLDASSNRAFIMLLPIALIISLGLFTVLQSLLKKKRKFFILLIFLIIFIEYVFYLDSYYTHLSIRYERDTFVGTKEVMNLIKAKSNYYEQVWLTDKLGGYIHLLFHLDYPPDLYQKQAKLGALDEYGFGHVDGFDKYLFRKLPRYFDFSKKILYIASVEESLKGVEPIEKTIYSDGNDAFYFFDTETVKAQCSECNLVYKPSNQDIYGKEIIKK